MNETLNYSVSTVIGVAVFAAFIGWIIYINKQHPTRSFGEVINFYFLQQKVSVWMISLFAICVAEAMWAASIHPKGEVQVNMASRLMTHGAISLVSIICGIYFPAGLRKVMTMKVTKPGERVSHILTTMVFLGVALILPYLNTLLIAGGLKEVRQFYYVCNGRFFVGFSHMSYAMMATTVAWLSHYILVFLDAMVILTNDDPALAAASNQGFGGSIHNTVNTNGEKASDPPKNESQLKDLIYWLLGRYELKGAELSKWGTTCIEAKDKLATNPTAQSKLASVLHDLKVWIQSEDKKKSSATDSEKAEIKANIYKKIHETFAASPNNGAGLGIRLPQKGN